MSKKILKRSLALGALMAFVITGSAWAAEFDKNDSVIHKEDDPKLISANSIYGGIYSTFESVGSYATKLDESENTFTGVEFKNINVIAKNNIAQGGIIYNNTGHTLNIDGCKFENISVKTDVNKKKASGGAIANVGGTLIIKDSTFTGISTTTKKVMGYGAAIFISGGEANISKSGFYSHNEGNANGVIYATGGAVLNIDGNTFQNNEVGTMLSIQSDATLNLMNSNKFIDNKYNDIFVKGTVVFAYDSDTLLEGGKQGLGIGDGAVVTMEKDSTVTAKNGVGIDANASKYTGLLNMKEGSVLEIGADSQIANLEATNATIKYLKDVDISVYRNTSTGLNFVVEDGTITDAVNGDMGEVVGDSFAGNEDGATFRMAKGDVVGDVSGKLVKDEETGMYVVDQDTVTEAPHEGNAAISHNANIAMMAWRAETNDMNKRLGELRNANGDLGVWVRMVGGEDEFKSVNHEYTQYQLGYDEKLSVDPSWTVGVALTYTDGESTFTNGSGENTHKGLSVYGSKLNDDGSFIDLIAKYSRLEHDITSAGDKGDYSTNGYSVSAEYGKRFQQGKGLWIEPQVELTYGKVKSAEYKLGDKTVSQDAMESLVGRVGFSLGKDIKQGNVYARASYLYDFEGETNMAFANSGARREFKYDLGGGWWEVGVGANINLSKATYIYADVEKTFGGEVDTNWQWNLGVRYSF